MKITICGSSVFGEQMLEYQKKLNDLGHEGIVHPDYKLLLDGEKEDVMDQMTNGEHYKAKMAQGYIMWYYNAICESDAILILNFDKKGIKNYIGGNTLMEAGFAYVNKKKIFVLNPLPDISYSDEIKAMGGVILDDDIKKI